jgi:hypothetical protein
MISPKRRAVMLMAERSWLTLSSNSSPQHMDAHLSFDAPKLNVVLNCRLGGEHLGVNISNLLGRFSFFGKVRRFGNVSRFPAFGSDLFMYDHGLLDGDSFVSRCIFKRPLLF